MSEVGQVLDVHIPTDRDSGRPRGFAFVKFSSAEEVEEAIERFDGQELGGRPLRVNPAQERKSRGSRPAPQRFADEDDDFDGDGDFDRDDDYDRDDRRSDRFRSKSKGSRRGVRGKKRSL